MPVPTLLPEEQDAERFLQGLGLHVRPVAPSTSKTPEFIVEGDGRGYVVEVKARKDPKPWLDALNRGRVASQQRSTGFGRWTRDVAHQAVKQFLSADVRHEKWWVLWIAIRCMASPGATFQEIMGSLFGVRQVVYADPISQEHHMRDCLFATIGAFERHPEIVACVVDSGDGFGFGVNDEFASDFDSFQGSVLWSAFAHLHPPTTAAGLSQNQGFFRVDRSVNRADTSAVARHLAEAYKLQEAVLIDMKAHSASIATMHGKRSRR